MFNDLQMVSIEKLQKLKDMNPSIELVDLDFKEVFSIRDPSSKIETVKDLAAFSNTRGGYIVFGVTKNYQWKGLDERSDTNIDEADLQNLCDKYIDGKIEFVYSICELDGDEFLFLYIKPSNTYCPFKRDGTYMRKLRKGGENEEIVFRQGDVYCRRGSRSIKADHLFFRQKEQNFGIVHNLRNAPFHEFVGRSQQLNDLHDLLTHENTRLLQVDGIGGIGKTSLVYQYCLQLIDNRLENNFEFIVWMSSKRTIFTPEGERKERNFVTCFEDVINEIIKFLGPNELDEIEDLVQYAIDLVQQNKVLLVIDNMETLLDKDLIEFLFNLPRGAKALLTTREVISNFQMSKLTLLGLNSMEFDEFSEAEYGRLTGKSFSSSFDTNCGEFFQLTKGMPLAIQLVINQLSLNAPVSTVIKGLRSGKTYEGLLMFCFQGSFERLNLVEKCTLYILSLPGTDELLTLQDLEYITVFSDDNLSLAIQKLTKLSLCYSEETKDGFVGYTNQHLVKLYIRQQDVPDKQTLLEQYSKFSTERNLIIDASISNEQFFIQARALTHDQRMSALKVKNIMSSFHFNGYDKAMELLDRVADESKEDFGYVYYLKGKIEIMSGLYESELRAAQAFSKATRIDPDLLDAWIEWGYQEKRRPIFAKQYFEQALSIDPKNLRGNHGYAHSLSQIAKKSGNKELALLADKHYGLAYYSDVHSNEDRHSNAINAHSQTINVVCNLDNLDKALEICEFGLSFEPKNNRLLTLKGEIKKDLQREVPTSQAKSVSTKGQLTEGNQNSATRNRPMSGLSNIGGFIPKETYDKLQLLKGTNINVTF